MSFDPRRLIPACCCVAPLPAPAVGSGLVKIDNIRRIVHIGLYHLSTARLDVSMSVIRSIGLNSLGGLAFGWLFRNKGLQSAMIAHTAADIIFYVIAPYFISF